MKKFFLILMVIVIMTTTSFAAFSDLPDGHWAKGVVEEMVKEGIISGYTDGTFRPSKEISKIESLILLSRVAGLNKYQTEAEKYLETYSSTLAKYSTQYKKDVAYLLGVGVLKTSDLDNLLDSSKINSALSREEMAVLVTKVLGKESEATKNSIVVLPFNDTSSISASAKPYVYYVYSQGIMAGMTDGSFSPKTALTRAQAASVFQRIYKKVDIKPSTTPSTNPNATSFVTGTITKIDTSASSVWIKANGNTEEYEYDSNTKFYISSKQVTSASMKVNATVTATLTDSSYITSMNISEGGKVVTKTVKGTIYAASSTSKTISVTTNGSRIAYTYDNATTYKLDGKTSTLIDAIQKDYEVTLTVDTSNYIVSADVTSPKSTSTNERIIGEITEANAKKGYIVIETSKGKEYILMDEYVDNYTKDDEDYYFDDDTDFKYNGTKKTYKNVATSSYLYKEGYFVAITIGKKSTIDLIEIASKESNLDEDSSSSSSSGDMIAEIIKADKSIGYIVVEDVDKGKTYVIIDGEIDEYDKDYKNKNEDYYFDTKTEFYYEGSSKTYKNISTTSYLYNEGYYVKLTFGKNEYIKEIEVASKESKLDSSSSSSSNSSGDMIAEIVEADKSVGYIVVEDVDKGKTYIIMDDEINKYAKDYKNKSEDYYFDTKTKFYYEGSSKTYKKISTTSYLYNEGYYVKLTFGKNDYVKEIEVASKESKLSGSSSNSSSSYSSKDMVNDNYLVGEITSITEDELVVKADDSKKYTISVASKAVVVNYNATNPSSKMVDYVDAYDDGDIDKKDRVMVVLCKSEETALIILLD